MAKAIVLLAPGFEEIEAAAIIDVLRRGGIEVTVAALGETRVPGAHDLSFVADCRLKDVEHQSFDAVLLPGGMPGSRNLRDDVRVKALLQRQAEQGRQLGAICAAPIALEAAGVLQGKRATSYPGYDLPSAEYCEDRVVVDGNVVTSRGPGTAIEFALQWVTLLAGADQAAQLRQGMLVS